MLGTLATAIILSTVIAAANRLMLSRMLGLGTTSNQSRAKCWWLLSGKPSLRNSAKSMSKK
ncbi:MAG: hypothetical protein SFW36_00830 [Leptolyngbyaceae cyanobacterium bins.59]|nr:hypothetical protein [Leptolyngbyaceae cyanobacterium bins.59]